MKTAIRFHLPGRIREGLTGREQAQFYRPLIDGLRARGARVEVEPYESRAHRDIRPDGVLHIVNNGVERGENILNAGIAYLDGYWHLDAQGILADSSIGGFGYTPGKVPADLSWPHFERLLRRYVEPRHSRYQQPEVSRAAAEPGCIALFLQGESFLTDRARLCSTPDMIRAVARGAGGRRVLVKPHPLKVGDDDLAAVEEMRAEGADIDLYDGNVHDLLSVCAASAAISSACCFEGFLHKKPALLFGRSDFHHKAHMVPEATPEAFAAALATALAAPRRGYSQYVYWYLARCLDATGDRLVDQALDRMAAAGFDAERLGLAAPNMEPA